MQEDINLTHRLGQFRSNTARPAPTPTPHREAGPVERRLRRDGFMDFAFGVFAVFFLAQFLLMGWFLFG